MTDPRRAQLTDLLRSCIECGLCLPHCATYVATGNEVHSPRGRLLLLGDVLEAPLTAAPSYLEAFDVCIGCRACETACPSGVPFSLLAWGQDLATARGVGRGPGWLRPVVDRLDNPDLLRVLRVTSGAARRVLRWVAGPRWRHRLHGTGRMVRLLGSLPAGPARDTALVRQLNALTGLTVAPPPRAPEVGVDAPPVVFFRGCANEGLLPHTSRRLLDILARAGYRVVTADGQDCCGALAAHSGRPGRAAGLRRRNTSALRDTRGPVLVEAAGCGQELSGYADAVAHRVEDAAAFLSRSHLPALGHLPLKVVLHDPCHARHGQNLVAEPRALLRRIPGLELVEAVEEEVCCGSGGVWSLRHGDLSEQLGRRKAQHLAATGAQLAVTTNPGCLGQIADGLARDGHGLPLIPLTDLIWYAVAAGC